MIVLRRLGGGLFALNPDLVERVEATPDTVVTLIDDKKFLVEESLDEVLSLIVDYRAYIIVRSTELSVATETGRPTLHVVPNEHVTTLENSLAPGVDLDFGSRQRDGLDDWLDEVDQGGTGSSAAGHGRRDGDGDGSVVSSVNFGADPAPDDPDGSMDSGLNGGGS